MIQGIRDTSNDTFRRLLGNGIRYSIPKYQRDYSWTEEQWSDLFYDIENALKSEEAHYMGYLVLQTDDNKIYQIIDGQQRITTICILILAVIKRLGETGTTEEERRENRLRAESFRATYIGDLDTITLQTQNKLKLNRNNDTFYRQFIVPLETFPQRGLSSTEKLMKLSFDFFERQLAHTYKTGTELAIFTDKLVDSLFFTVITVSDELNAFRVFETLNARGVQLSSSDLLKNYLFSIIDAAGVHKTELDTIEELWSQIMEILKNIQFSEYLRIYWNSTHKTVRKNELYKTIRNEVKNREQAFALLRDMRKQADVYIALKTPEDEHWNGRQEIQDSLRLLNLFNVTQPLALLMAAYKAYGDGKEFVSLLKQLVTVSFRYTVIGGKNANIQEQVYNEITLDVLSTKIIKRNKLFPLYLKDEFEELFSYAEFTSTTRNKKIARYILSQIEHFTEGICLDEDKYTLEHIMPESPSPGKWPLSEQDAEKFTYRLGNMTLLEGTKNKNLGNSSFAEKKRVYAESTVPMTKEIGQMQTDEWGPEEIDRRQKQLAKKAAGIWKADFT